MRFHLSSLALLLSSALVAGPAAAHGPHAQSVPAACLALPADKVAIQTYVFAPMLAGITIPPEWDALPVIAKFAQLRPQLARFVGARPEPAKLSEALAAIAAAGYRNIEGGGLSSAGDAQDYAALLKQHGLKSVAEHVDLDKARWPAALAAAKSRGQRYIGSGGFGAPGLNSLDNVLATARNLNELGAAAAAQGLTLFVHNHTGEFDNRFLYDHGDGKPVMTSAWEIVAANTDPRLVQFEVDVFWARLGLGPERFDELLAFLKKYRSRIALLHMKDLAANGAVADLGKGTTDWRRVVEAAGPQIAYYIYEYDLPSDPARSARIGFDFLTCAGRK